MILSDSKILEAIAKKEIVIEPYDRDCLGTNSYDVHLGKHLAVYVDPILDARKHNLIREFEIPEEGFVLMPGTLYLNAQLAGARAGHGGAPPEADRDQQYRVQEEHHDVAEIEMAPFRLPSMATL